MTNTRVAEYAFSKRALYIRNKLRDNAMELYIRSLLLCFILFLSIEIVARTFCVIEADGVVM